MLTLKIKKLTFPGISDPDLRKETRSTILDLPTKDATNALKPTCSEDGVNSGRDNVFRVLGLGTAGLAVVLLLILLSVVFIMTR